MAKLQEGDNVGIFSLNSTLGSVSLPNCNNKYTLLYFYPKDDTPGCTVEAKEFTELKEEFENCDTLILGVSKDSLDSHKKFTEKHELKINLVSDNGELAEAFGVWVEKNMYGKKYMGIERASFLLDKENKVLKIWNKVKAKGHAQAILEHIKNI